MHKLFEALKLDVPGFVATILNVVVAVLILVLAVKVVNSIFRRTEKRLAKTEKAPDSAYLNFFRYLVLAVVYLLFLSAISSSFPTLNSLMKTVLAGSGIVALVAGVACQDTLSNLAAGIMIVFSHPFKKGDTVRYVSANLTGEVEEITLRHTIIKTFDNKRLIIPNSTINSSIIENNDYADERVCIFVDVSITYESDVRRALALLAETVAAHPDSVDTRTPEQIAAGVPQVRTRLTELADSAVVIRAWMWAQNTSSGAAMKGDVLLTLMDVFPANGIEFAYPHLVVQKS